MKEHVNCKPPAWIFRLCKMFRVPLAGLLVFMFHRLNVEDFEQAPFFSPLATEAPFRSLVRQLSHRAVRSYTRKALFLFGFKFVLYITTLHKSMIGFFVFSQVGVNFFCDADKQRNRPCISNALLN